jgi:hypothetical protein
MIATHVHKQPLHDANDRLPLVRSEFGDDAGISGAALLARGAAAARRGAGTTVLP